MPRACQDRFVTFPVVGGDGERLRPSALGPGHEPNGRSGSQSATHGTNVVIIRVGSQANVTRQPLRARNQAEATPTTPPPSATT